MGSLSPPLPFPIHVAQGYRRLWCSASLGSNSGLALCLWLENKTFLFLCCVLYHGWGRRCLPGAKAWQSYYRKATPLCLWLPLHPSLRSLEVAWRVLQLQRPRVQQCSSYSKLPLQAQVCTGRTSSFRRFLVWASFSLTQIALQRDPSLLAFHSVSEGPRHGWIYRKANLCCSEAPGSGALADRATLF